MSRVKTPHIFPVFGSYIPVFRPDRLIQDHSIAGYYDPEKKEIHIDSSLQGDEFIQTLCHELGHALFDRVGIVQSKMPLELQEVIVEVYATMMVEAFRLESKRGRKIAAPSKK